MELIQRVIYSFAAIAPELYSRGWRGLIPIAPGYKYPRGMDGWERYNSEDQTLQQLEWLMHQPLGQQRNSGVGCCSGNGVMGIDLDFLEVDLMNRAYHIAVSILGSTPFVRQGTPPKLMLYYRSHFPKLQRNPQNLSFEIYPGGRPASGQFVLAATLGGGAWYAWARGCAPWELTLEAMPWVTEEQVLQMISALVQDPVLLQRGRVRHAGGGGGGALDGSWVKGARNALSAGSGALADWIRHTGQGGRHYAGLAAAMVTIWRGLDPEDEEEALDELGLAYEEAKPGTDEWKLLVKWAREKQKRQYTASEIRQKLRI